MNTLKFIATGDKYNSYDAYYNNVKFDSCDINSEQCVTQAHVVIASLKNTLRHSNFVIVFDDTKAIHKRTRYSADKLISMSEFAHLTGMCRIYDTLVN